MKKIAAALALGVGAFGAQAAIVGWQFKGLTDHGFNPDGTIEIVPFALYIEMDTAAIANGTQWDGPGSARNGARFEWKIGPSAQWGYCGVGWIGTLASFQTSANGFKMQAMYPNNDCAVSINFVGSAGPLEVLGDPLTNWYDTSSFAAEILLSGNHSFRSLSVTYAAQMIPEPSPVALIGAGLAGLIWVRRRKDTREQA